jgi:peptidoglycan/LPS O-acetylase OafA/YrhL
MATSTAPNRNVDPDLGSRLRSTARSGEKLFPPGAESQRAATAERDARGAGTRHFLRHLGEMVLAMMFGMVALAALDAAIFAAAGTSIPDVKDSAPEVWGLLMALNMTVGMTVWMRHRRHTWAMCAEMAGAMFFPAVAAIVLFWCSAIHGGSIGRVEMTAMLPAMVAVMLLRRTEYSQPVHSRAREAVGQG